VSAFTMGAMDAASRTAVFNDVRPCHRIHPAHS